jgi:phosphoserine phosphatase
MRTDRRAAIVVGMDHSVLQRPSRVAGGGHLRVVPPWTGSPGATPATRATMTVTGRNQAGVVERLFGALAEPCGAGPALELVEVAQVVMHEQLVLVAGVRAAAGTGPRAEDAVLARLVRAAVDLSAATGLRVQVEAADAHRPSGDAPRRCRVTLLGRPVPLDAVAGVTRATAEAGGAVEAIWQLQGEQLTGIELVVTGAAPATLCAKVASVAATTGADIAVEQEDDDPAHC